MLCSLGLHVWKGGCVCLRCGRNRDASHAWDGCVCVHCRKERHTWAQVNEEIAGTRRITEPGEQVWDFAWSDTHTIPAEIEAGDEDIVRRTYRCSRCGELRVEEDAAIPGQHSGSTP